MWLACAYEDGGCAFIYGGEDTLLSSKCSKQ